jgi:hypothetical protein
MECKVLFLSFTLAIWPMAFLACVNIATQSVLCVFQHVEESRVPLLLSENIHAIVS